MKVLKKIIQAILCFIIFNLIVLYVLSINIKSLLINDIMKEVIKEGLKDSNIEDLLPSGDSKQLLIDLIEKDESDDLISKYSSIILNSFSNDENPNINLEEDLISIINNNKPEIENKLGPVQTKIIIMSLEEFKIHRDLSKQIENSIELSKNNLSEKEKLVLKIYNIIISNDFKNTILLILIITIILLLLLSKSIYTFIKLIAQDLLFSGIAIVLLVIISNQVIQNNINKSLSLTNSNLYKTGILLSVIGITILIISISIKTIINKIKNHK